MPVVVSHAAPPRRERGLVCLDRLVGLATLWMHTDTAVLKQYLGSHWLNGRGPAIPIYTASSGNVAFLWFTSSAKAAI